MVSTIKKGIGWDLVRVHKAITRSMEVILSQSRGFAVAGFPDVVTQAGFTDYVRCFQSFVHAHHITEEELAFPYFRTKLPDEPYDTMLAEHSQIAWLVYEIRGMVGEPGGVAIETGKLKNLESAMTDIDQIWRQHFPKEENSFSPQHLDQVMSIEQQAAMSRQFGEHSARHAAPDYLVTPFFLMNLEGEDREAIAENLPSLVTQQLVPVVWKDKWAPMRPFLLP